MLGFWLGCALVVGFAVGWLVEKLRQRPPEVPSQAFFMERDREPVDEAERMRRVVRAAIEDWHSANRRKVRDEGRRVRSDEAMGSLRGGGVR